MNSPATRSNSSSDISVRHTDFDALSMRYASVTKHYFDDLFVPIFVNGINNNLVKLLAKPGLVVPLKRVLKTNFSPRSISQKLPIINRGTYIRTVAINKVINQFLNSVGSEKCQIVSLGAGSDTRVFDLLSKHKNLTYHETDLEESTMLKLSVIACNESLRQIVGDDPDFDTMAKTLDSEPSNFPSQLHRKRYHLQPLDLRNIDSVNKYVSSLDNVPTLILSECVFCYIEPQITAQILEAFKALDKGLFVIYEPIGLDDEFGRVMTENLQNRGLALPSLNSVSSLDLQIERLGKVCDKVCCSDMDFVYKNWVDEKEAARVSRLELLDEVEEWVLLSKHYVLVMGVWGLQVEQGQLKWQKEGGN